MGFHSLDDGRQWDITRLILYSRYLKDMIPPVWTITPIPCSYLSLFSLCVPMWTYIPNVSVCLLSILWHTALSNTIIITLNTSVIWEQLLESCRDLRRFFREHIFHVLERLKALNLRLGNTNSSGHAYIHQQAQK